MQACEGQYEVECSTTRPRNPPAATLNRQRAQKLALVPPAPRVLAQAAGESAQPVVGGKSKVGDKIRLTKRSDEAYAAGNHPWASS